MSEELQKALGELLNKANHGIDAASGFLAAELPDVIQQLLMWNIYHSVIWCLIYSICFSLCLWGSVKCIKFVAEEPEMTVACIFPVGGSIVFILCAIDEFSEALKIYISPKVWLLEYVASLTK